MTHPYDYPSTFAVKILVKKGNDTLLIREPATNEWMPGRLGLPGGKLVLNETIEDGIKRKINTEIGLEINVDGLIKLVDIIMPTKTVYILIVHSSYMAGDLSGRQTESDDVKWYTPEEIKQLKIDDYTEYFLPQILQNPSHQVVPLSFILTQDNRQPEITAWMTKGSP